MARANTVEREQARRGKIARAMRGNRNGTGWQPGRSFTDSHRANLSKSGRGRVFSEEHRRKLSLASMGNKRGAGRQFSSEVRARIAASVKRSWEGAAERKALQSSRSLGNAWYQLREWTPEQRTRLSENASAHAALDLPDCGCPIHDRSKRLGAALQGRRTRLEHLLVDRLLAEFPEVREQEPFGDYVVDAYLSAPYHLAFEADGEYWHRFPKKEAARDKYLLRRFNLPVVHLSGSFLSEAYRGQS